MDPESKNEGVIDTQNTPSSKKQNERPSSKGKKGKRKKRFRIPAKLLASIWWIATFATLTIGIIGLVKVILQIYLRGSPDWSYALIINPDYENVEMAVYSFKGNKRDLSIRHMENVSLIENTEFWGTTNRIREAFSRAVRIIPWLSRSSSPVIFAGAGNMRMIKKRDEKNYDRIMKGMNLMIQKSPLKYFPQTLRILDDWEEALYGWVTLNYLLDHMMKGRQPIKSKRDTFTTVMTVGSLDLDETSLHVSYEIPRLLDSSNLEDDVKKNTKLITLYGRDYYIYTRTLQCFGSKRLFNMYITYRERSPRWKSHYDSYDYVVGGLNCVYEELESHYWFWDLQKTRIVYERGHPFAIKNARLSESCTNFKRSKKDYKVNEWHMIYFYGGGNSDNCLKEVKQIVDNCKTYFDNFCPDFNFPKRPYDITFIVYNEFAIYAKLVGLKSGDPKSTWDQKRKKVCKKTCTMSILSEFPPNTDGVTRYHYDSLCLMITFLYYFLSEKLNLTESEWKKLTIMRSVDETKMSWYLGYIANITNALPTTTPFYGEISLQNLFVEGIIFTAILSISSVTTAFALRNSNVLAVRPIRIPC